MKYNKFLLITFLMCGSIISCKKELDVRNPNQPTPSSAATEDGIIAVAQGGVYISGFRGLDNKFYDGVPGYFWTGAVGLHSLMGDEITEEAANWFANQVGCPDEIILDNGTSVLNPQSPSSQYELLRTVNDNANLGDNPTFHEWANMYSLNNACNSMLEIVEKVTFLNDGDVKKSTIKAWAYFWKGFAYGRIGSIYYAGLINSEAGLATSAYVTKEAIIAESNANYEKAADILRASTAGGAYDEVMAKLIPNFCQVGLGAVPTPAMWIHSINTMKARNILVNTPAAAMTSAQWDAVESLTNEGIQKGDMVFTGRSNGNGDVWSSQSGFISNKSAGPAGTVTYKISERLTQDFKAGDQRLAHNFNLNMDPWIGNADRGTTLNTRYDLVDGGNGIAGVKTFANKADGALEFYLAGNYEENALMNAEAKIYKSQVEAGLGIIDAVRTEQGAGLAATAGTSLSASAAKEELRKERRCALAFLGLAFYDARRLGISEKGSSRTGCVVVDKNGATNNNVTIKYNFLDYWDVPDNELAYNPAGTGSVPTKNPK
jgi:starch-binding outer membrane protein, SusD/RagB family